MAEVEDGNIHRQEEEIQEIKWTTFLETLSLLTFDNDIALFKRAIKYYESFHGEYDD